MRTSYDFDGQTVFPAESGTEGDPDHPRPTAAPFPRSSGPELIVSSIPLVCGGFLLAVLWMDLMFDVQVLSQGASSQELPESVLSSIASYYERVTTRARPMGHLVAAVMVIGTLSLLFEALRSGERWWISLVSLALFGAPAILALVRVYPDAVRLGARTDCALEQTRLARAILRSHLICLAAMVLFIALRLFSAHVLP
jgi:hypothetical protein